MSVERVSTPVGYAGLVTRAVALVIDLLAINLIAALTGGLISLLASLLGHSGGLDAGQAVTGGTLWVLWIALYFVVFWNLTGQTPGDRLLGIRVFSTTGSRIRIRQAALRFLGMVLAALPLGAGFIPVLYDDRRRGLHDRIAKTVVRWDSEELPEVLTAELAASSADTEAPIVPVAGQHLPIG
jgi:uncharacterized RDD family membrane protein YckC